MIEERDLAEFSKTILTGITVGSGSLVLLFANGAHVLVQCPFELLEQGTIRHGHGEHTVDSTLLFGYLNCTVESAAIDDGSILTFNFECGRRLRIVPERNGFESYVITTRYGICPVIAI